MIILRFLFCFVVFVNEVNAYRSDVYAWARIPGREKTLKRKKWREYQQKSRAKKAVEENNTKLLLFVLSEETDAADQFEAQYSGSETHFAKRQKLDERATRRREAAHATPDFKAGRIPLDENGNRRPFEHGVPYGDRGKMDLKCEFGCGAVHFSDEETSRLCCDHGKGPFEHLEPLPNWLLEQLHIQRFRDNIRFYQNAVLGASAGGSYRRYGNWPGYYKLNGQLYHALPPVIPGQSDKPRFVQVYMLDAVDDQVEARMTDLSGFPNVEPDRSFSSRLSELIAETNPHAIIYKSAFDDYFRNNLLTHEVGVEILDRGGRYGKPTVDEMSVFLPDQHTNINASRSVRLRNVDGSFYSIDELSPLYDPLRYVLMFPHGEVGYYWDRRNRYENMCMTCLRYYQQLLQERPFSSHPLFDFGKCCHEYALDQWVKVEKGRLDYVRTHQEQVRADAYSGIVDFMHVGSNDPLGSTRQKGTKGPRHIFAS